MFIVNTFFDNEDSIRAIREAIDEAYKALDSLIKRCFSEIREKNNISRSDSFLYQSFDQFSSQLDCLAKQILTIRMKLAFARTESSTAFLRNYFYIDSEIPMGIREIIEAEKQSSLDFIQAKDCRLLFELKSLQDEFTEKASNWNFCASHGDLPGVSVFARDFSLFLRSFEAIMSECLVETDSLHSDSFIRKLKEAHGDCPSRLLALENWHSSARKDISDCLRMLQTTLQEKFEALKIRVFARLEAEKKELLLLEEDKKRKFQEALRKESAEKRATTIQAIRDRLEGDFLSADSMFMNSWHATISLLDYENEKIDFVKDWFAKHHSQDINKHILDDEQAAAISSVHGHIHVVARAGSGKTTTLVNRAVFLIRHCGTDPESILLLAFNRKAATEIRRRILESLSEVSKPMLASETGQACDERKAEEAVFSVATKLKIVLPYVMTFHALARAIAFSDLHGKGIQAPDLLVDHEFDRGQSRVLQQIIDEHLKIPNLREKFRKLMLKHFREDWVAIMEGGYDRNREEFLKFRRSLQRQSLRGEFVKSFGEKVIADFLFEHNIPYKYERNHWWKGVNYCPDFTIFHSSESGHERGIIIEYFGLEGDNDYDEMTDQKRAYWKARPGWQMIEFSPQDIKKEGKDKFLEVLKKALEKLDCRCSRLSEDEIWLRVKDRAIDRFTSAMRNFIGRCRKRVLSPKLLQGLIDRYAPIMPSERLFHDIAYELFESYMDRLSATGEEDFDGLMLRAITAVNEGCTTFQRRTESGDIASLKYIFIDEFQDFSELFYRLICAIRNRNERIQLFCVGDDWQAINGFAGSDLQYFERFPDFIGESRRLHISTNYRSFQSIVSIGNELMSGLGEPARSNKSEVGQVQYSDLSKFEPSLIEKRRHPGDVITPAILRLVHRSLSEGMDVVILSRTNQLNWYVEPFEARMLDGFLEAIRSTLGKNERDRVTLSTAHKYKGLEKSMVILIDAVLRSYPLIHPDWLFTRILGDNPEKIAQEERRLFYVALTRAIKKLIFITDGRNKSPFLEELESSDTLCEIDWKDYPPVQGRTAYLLVQVGNQGSRGVSPTLAIKDLLKAAGYQWQTVGWPSWGKSYFAGGFSLDKLKSEIWAKVADGIEVRVLNDFNQLVGQYFLNKGLWIHLVDDIGKEVNAE